MKQGIKALLVTLAWLICWQQLTKPVQALQQWTFDFNDGDLSDWTVVRSARWDIPSLPCTAKNKTVPAQWEIRNGQLGIEIDSYGCQTEIVANAVDLTNSENFQVDFDWTFERTLRMDRNGLLVWKDRDNWYDIKILENDIHFQKVVNGGQHGFRLMTSSGHHAKYPFVIGQTYHFTIQYEKPWLRLSVNGQKLLDMEETAPFITGFKTTGFQASVGSIEQSINFFDNLVVTVHDRYYRHIWLKQTDDFWATKEYDTGHEWSEDPTIRRWGCALTSLASIFRFHGLDTLPNGEGVWPDTLNDWLLEQPDGYIGDGLVNWIAAMRLSKQISDATGKPALEYSRRNGPDLTPLRESLAANRPAIVQIPGHFFVGTGLSDQNQIKLHDPYYDFSSFNQQNSYVISTRYFTPSFTDLSYILWIARDWRIDAVLYDDQQRVVTDFLYDSNGIKTPLENQAIEYTPAYTIKDKAKPPAGTYYLVINRSQPGPIDFTLIGYDQAGNPTLFSESTEYRNEALIYKIVIGNDSVSIESIAAIEPAIDFLTFRQLLHQQQQAGDLRKYYAFLRIDRVAALAEQADSNQTDTTRYHDNLKQLLAKYQWAFAPAAFAELTQVLTPNSS